VRYNNGIMIVQRTTSLAPFTSLATGGIAEQLIVCESTDEVQATLQSAPPHPIWLLGYGCNSLISDKGLPGTTIVMQGGSMHREGDTIVADAGVWWDSLVEYAISEGLWGLELTSAVPGGVGAAIRGNIAAYGQAVADTLAWADLLDIDTHETTRVHAADLKLSYRYSLLQESSQDHLLVLRAAFSLQPQTTHQVTYKAALDAAQKGNFDLSTLSGRRNAIMSAREQAESLWDYRDVEHEYRSAGSFFRNPLVTPEQAEVVMSFDETGRSAELLRNMNAVHGGDSLRVSAAHVLLAAGFSRGQAWGSVRLSPRHILKLENTGDATSQHIYDVASGIVATVQDKLGITLVPEVKYLGDFS
jgi:UDP-N-acetylmuramate dehydrogenase